MYYTTKKAKVELTLSTRGEGAKCSSSYGNCSLHSTATQFRETFHTFNFDQNYLGNKKKVGWVYSAHCSKLEIVLNENDTPHNQQLLLVYIQVLPK